MKNIKLIINIIISVLLIISGALNIWTANKLQAKEEEFNDLQSYMLYGFGFEQYDRGYAEGYADGEAGNPNIWG